MAYPKSLSTLMEELQKLPGIGPKSAQRLAFFMLKVDKVEAQRLAHAIIDMKEKIGFCSTCFQVTEQDPCLLCSDPKRDHSVICVVENPSDVLAFERLGKFNGIYHVLMGAISPLEGVGPDQLTVKALIQRLSGSDVKEVILATDSNAEGETTALYLTKLLKPLGMATTRLARGLPVGGDLEYADEDTLAHALSGRLPT